ncbi:hypothetical protein IWX90DRAFT_57787 [Phyllosticta citrichinensis]|uniref:F-box domain-containing protein n=1 Tax=Phyllosticta citrichinensis TaxID=1130410 RepID=A0ABR1XGW7_9PEZI
MRHLDTLPFDVLFEVARYLALDDVAALGCASRRLRGAVKGEEALCRMVVQNNTPFAREALLASQAERNETATASSQIGSPSNQQQQPAPKPTPPTFRAALQSIHARRAAFASASPRSACIVDYAADFLYEEGLLCSVYSQPRSSSGRDAVKIRVLNVEEGGREVAVLDVGAIAHGVVESAGAKEGGEGDEGPSKRRRQEEREGSPWWDAEMPFGDMAYCAAATLGFEAPLWDEADSPSLSGRSRSASPCSLASTNANRSSSSTSPTYPLPRVTLVHCSASILSLYLNFSSTHSAPSTPSFLKHHPHYLVAVRLAKTACSSVAAPCLRVFRLPNRLGGYGSDNDFVVNDAISTSSEGEGDGAGRGLKLFVRNTDAYYYFGTHTGCGRRGERFWVVHGVSLKEGTPLKIGSDNDKTSAAKGTSRDGSKRNMAKLALPQMASKALGSDTCFFIHEGHFYGLTTSGSALTDVPADLGERPAINQDQLQDPHVSTYNSIRFPLELPTPDAVETGSRVFRRHHGIEGPINDAWTALDIALDEASGGVKVIEERREWGQGTGTQGGGRSVGGERSWYFGTLGFDEEDSSSERDDDEEEEEGMAVSDGGDSSSASGPARLSPTGSLRASGQPSQPQSQPSVPSPSAYPDAFTSPFDGFLPDFNVAWSDATRPWIRRPARVHREHLHYATAVPKEAGRAEALRSFTLSRTKHRAYDYSAKTFLDLVEDEKCCSSGPCLRLRVGARRENTRQPNETRAAQETSVGEGELQGQDGAYVHNRARMWPPASSSSSGGGRAGCQCWEKLHGIMNAPLSPCRTDSPVVNVVAVTDRRGVVFLRRAKYGGGRERTGPLVLMSFDAGVAAEGLDGLGWKREWCCSC